MKIKLARGASSEDTHRHRQGTWSWPFLIALAFSAAVAAWLHRMESTNSEEQRRTLIQDTLTLRGRLEEWLAAEESIVNALGQKLDEVSNDTTLARNLTVADGLRRLWISVTVLDSRSRLLAHLPKQAPAPSYIDQKQIRDENSISAHLDAPTRSGGRLIVRFDLDALLHKAVPWWISRKYEVRLLDEYGQLMAANSDATFFLNDVSYRVSLDFKDGGTYLELTPRDIHTPWWRSMLPTMIAIFLALSAGTSWALRRQMLDTNRARDLWREEASWRKAIEDSLKVGLVARDMQGRIVHVNRAFCDMVGYSVEELIGVMPPMPYWLPDAAESDIERIEFDLSKLAPREGAEVKFRRSDGCILDVMLVEAPWINSSSGHQIGWMGSMVDISARKMAEERERRQLEMLANQARLTMLGEVASALAHQLNQPLTAIAGYNAGVLQMLQSQKPSDDQLVIALQDCSVQIDEAGRIVQRIRSFLTRRTPQCEVHDVQTTIAHAVDLLRKNFELRGIQIDMQSTKRLPLVWVDPVLIEQVVINLLRNSADAMEGQDIAHIRISTSIDSQNYVCISVDDSGPGLDQLGIDELSSPFYTSKNEGMGMGLAICRSVVEAHRGALSCGKSDLGGAQFIFTIPISNSLEQ